MSGTQEVQKEKKKQGQEQRVFVVNFFVTTLYFPYFGRVVFIVGVVPSAPHPGTIRDFSLPR